MLPSWWQDLSAPQILGAMLSLAAFVTGVELTLLPRGMVTVVRTTGRSAGRTARDLGREERG